MAGLCRISVVPESGDATDLAVPDRVAVAEMLPELVRLLGAPGAARLVTVTGHEVRPDVGLRDQGIADGAVLALVGPAPVDVPSEDPAEAVAAVVRSGVLGWHPRLVAPVARLGCGLFLALAGWALATGPGWSGSVAAAAAVGLGGAAVVAVRRRHDRLMAAALGWAAVGFAAVAGGQYAGSVAACGSAAAAAVLLARVVRGVGLLLVPAAVAAVVLAGLTALATWSQVDPGLLAALGLVGVGLASVGLPRAALASARGDTAVARELMRALMAAVAVVMLVLTVPTAAHGVAGAGLVGAVALHVVCLGSRHHGAVEVVTGLAVGAAMMLLAAGVVVVTRPQAAGGLGVIAVVLGLGLAVVAGGDMAGEGDQDPRLVLAIDRIETVALLAIVPLLLTVADAVTVVRHLVHG
ncbi:EsaB/YukD family protein [Nocardioides jiangxiensis]|uniref:EsaB/YukD family protein n=1 Tax=Nocardioides jiangxiensis TaxID=3064524 RepID=A0ABT9B0S7_9ACTN|nr:EsaB/YukD family protein [Nocardioides sp. WY-20]MDO7868005.1 EsaB/YukD family protein [Nocardioides sp. WY-20]